MPDPKVLDMPMADTSRRPKTLSKFVCEASSFLNSFFLSRKSKLTLTMLISMLMNFEIYINANMNLKFNLKNWK